MITFLRRTVFIVALAFISIFAQAGSYYDSLNTSSASFISDLGVRLRAPYTQIAYDSFILTNINNFASRDTTNGKRVVTCVYSGENYVYTPPFNWTVYSREHTWCQSWMPSNPGGTSNMTSTLEGSDQHHIFPVNDNKANGVRNNHPLGKVDTVKGTFLSAKIGISGLSGKTVYEPRDQHKGDAARALLYMTVRYNGVNGYDWSFNKLQTYLTSHSEGPQDVATLLAWHKQDPPDKWEIDRNNYVQSIQQNRNPFIDHPEYVNYINFNDLSKLSPTYAAEPVNYPTGLNVNYTSALNINWTDAVPGAQAPSGYLLIAYDYNNYFLPIDGESYTNDSDLSDGKAVVNINYSDPDTYSFSGLTNDKRYYFTLIPYNGSGTSINYKINGTLPQASGVYNPSPVFEPTVQSSNLSFNNETSTSLMLSFTAGNGAYRIILAHAVSDVDADPVDGVTYKSSTVYGGGSVIGTGNYVVYKGNGNSVVVSGLSPHTVYYLKIYEFNGGEGREDYLTNSPASGNTMTIAVSVPTVQASALKFSNTASSSMTVSWKNGNGEFRIVLAKEGAPVDASPVDGTVYADGSSFASGSQIGTGNYIVYKGTDTAITVTGLLPSTAYYYAVYEFNGPDGQEKFLTTSPATGSQSTLETNHLMIAEVFGGGGNSGALYKNDFIVLYNPSSSAVNLSGWSVQYASAAGTGYSTGKTALSGSINAYSYYVIQEASGSGGSLIFPGSVVGNINLSGTAGKVAFVKSTTGITGRNDANVVDFVGFGPTASEYEGTAPAPSPSATMSIRRKLSGTQDSDDNSNDFVQFTIDGSTNLPLPVELSSFNFSQSGGKVVLNWKTASETNAAYFDIERRDTKVRNSGWNKAGTVKAHGSSTSANDYTFTDAGASAGSVAYRLKMVDFDGSFTYSSEINAEVAPPSIFGLSQNYPNPFNPSTVINYQLPADASVSLTVYDITGSKVADLVNEIKPAGYHTVNFNAINLASGIYFYRLSAVNRSTGENFTSYKKMVLIK